MLTVDGLVGQLRSSEGTGFDVEPDQVAVVVNRWIKRLAVASLWVRDEIELGPTVAGVDRYEIPPDVIEVHDVIRGGELSARKSVEDLFQLMSGSVYLADGPPWTVYGDRTDSTTLAKLLMVYPTPDTDGISLMALCSVVPTDLAGDQIPPFPEDQEETILNGAKATLYRDQDENPDEGDRFEAMFTTAAEALRRRRNTMVGSGAFRIPSYRDVMP